MGLRDDAQARRKALFPHLSPAEIPATDEERRTLTDRGASAIAGEVAAWAAGMGVARPEHDVIRAGYARLGMMKYAIEQNGSDHLLDLPWLLRGPDGPQAEFWVTFEVDELEFVASVRVGNDGTPESFFWLKSDHTRSDGSNTRLSQTCVRDLDDLARALQSATEPPTPRVSSFGWR